MAIVENQPHVPRAEMVEFIRLASLAPSGRNTQPWKFHVAGDVVEIHPDPSRRMPVADPDNVELFASLGCALENLLVAAAARGWAAEAEVPELPSPEAPIIVRFTGRTAPVGTEMAAAIERRHVNRQAYEAVSLHPTDRFQLESLRLRPGIHLDLVTERPLREAIVPVVAAAAREQFEDPAYVRELKAWLRYNEEEVALQDDGLPIETFGLPRLPRWAGSLVFDLFTGPEEAATRVRQSLEASSAFAVFSLATPGPRGWVELGRSLERFALLATDLGVQHSHANMACELPASRRRLAALLHRPDAHPTILLRLGYARPAASSPRRALDDMVS